MFNNQIPAKMKENFKRLVEEFGHHEADLMSDAPAVYVGTYRKYNGGSLFGQWVDITSFDSYDEFIEYCEALHSDEDDPELMFQDAQNFPDKWYDEFFGEEVFDRIKNYAEQDDRDAVDAYLSEMDDDDLDYFEERFEGKWDSEEDFAWHIFEECYEHVLPEFAVRYFDIEAFARDLFSDYTFVDGYVFSA